MYHYLCKVDAINMFTSFLEVQEAFNFLITQLVKTLLMCIGYNGSKNDSNSLFFIILSIYSHNLKLAIFLSPIMIFIY